MVSFKTLTTTLLAAAASFAGVARADEEWGSFTGEVVSVEYIFSKDYNLVSELTISLNSGWSLADLEGRNSGQIISKTLAYNTADSKYYSKINYTAVAVNDTSDSVCFEPVPIRISLNQEVSGGKQGRLVDGYFFIGCVLKTKIENYSAATASTSAAASSTGTIVTTSIASTAISTISSVASSAETTTATTASSSVSSETPASTDSAVVVSSITSSVAATATGSSETTLALVTSTGFSNGTAVPTVPQVNGASSNAVASILSVGALFFALTLLA